MQLLDTDVMVDILRGDEAALAWLEGCEEAPGLVGLVAMELMQGCENKVEMNKLIDKLKPFVMHWPSESSCNRALHTFARAHLSHKLGIPDALIGECAVELGASFCTFNVRHYRAIAALELDTPYARAKKKPE